jgi:cation transport ATPase
VILDCRLETIDQFLPIGRHMRRISLQSAIGGMPFCLGGVFIAAAGYLPPMAGGIPQEVIDMAVALKALWLRFHQVGLPIS